MKTTFNFVIEKDCVGLRLDIFLLQKLSGFSRSFIKNLIDEGEVLVNNKAVKAGYCLRLNNEIIVVLPEPQNSELRPENIAVEVVYEDNDLAVINKPQGLTVHPANGKYSGTLVNALLYKMGDLSQINGVFRPGIVHRLDKDTSGLLVVAKNDRAHLSLSKQIQDKTCRRIYRALLNGKVTSDEGEIKTHLARGSNERKKIFVVPESKGRLAVTKYKVLQRFAGFTYIEFELKTGRTHQIRVHAAHIGHSVVGDKTYGKTKDKFNLDGQLLHAYKLCFIHPTTNKPLEFVAKLPDYFENVLNSL